MNHPLSKSDRHRSQEKKQKERYRFFLNPSPEMALTRCPKCDAMTRIRKYPLAIHIEPNHILCLNTSCRYCLHCDLIIANKERLEQLLYAICEQHSPEIIGNDYFVFGTLERKDWKQGEREQLVLPEALDRIYLFKEVWQFEVKPRGWYPSHA